MKKHNGEKNNKPSPAESLFLYGMMFFSLQLMIGNDLKAGNENNFHSADSLMVLGQYQYAAIEYERGYFLSEDISERNSALLHKAECYKALKKFDLAEKCLMRINYFNLPDTIVYLAREQTALCAYLAEHFSTAESQLLQLRYLIKDTSFFSKSLLLYTLVLNELDKWDEAKSALHQWVNCTAFSNPTKDSLNREVDILYNNKNYPKLKKVETARMLSFIVPGTGQIYAGYFWEGVANASMQGAALLLTAYGIYTGYYATSAIIWFSLFQKLYSGAITRTEYLVEKRNYKLARNYNDRIKNYISLLSALK